MQLHQAVLVINCSVEGRSEADVDTAAEILPGRACSFCRLLLLA